MCNVISCTPEIERKSQKIDAVVAVAETYLAIWDLASEELHGVLKGGVPSSQAVGVVQEQIGSK
jgi:hypothetical protein